MATAGFNFLDSARRVQFGTAYTGASSTNVDWTFFKKYYYATMASTFIRFNTIITTDLESFSIPTDPNSTIVPIGRGLTHNGKYLIFVVKDNLGVVADSLIWTTSRGTFVRRVALSTGLLNTYGQVTFLKKNYYIIDNVNKRVDIFDSQGILVSRFGLTAAKTYIGITNNTKHLWILRSDVTEHSGGTIEEWDIYGNQIQKFGNPNGGAGLVNYNMGIGFNKKYLFTNQTIIPIDLG